MFRLPHTESSESTEQLLLAEDSYYFVTSRRHTETDPHEKGKVSGGRAPPFLTSGLFIKYKTKPWALIFKDPFSENNNST
jgi:hypothetical protein